jgi:glycosyltransferase involved in cell wall biosynthesis
MTEPDPGTQRAPICETALIMTVLNEEASLPTFLNGLMRQSCLPAQIIVTDGGSVDRTLETLKAWKVPRGVDLIVISMPSANISQGRNAAIARCSYNRIVVTDAGTTPDPEWLHDLLAAFDRGADVVSGFFNPTGQTLFEKTLARAVTPLLDEIDPNRFLPSSRSVGFTKRAWASVSGYPEWLDYCEDLVFDLALRATGARFIFVPEAVVTWSARSDLLSFGLQYFRYARGDGKAGLFAYRHAARYIAYTSGSLLFLKALSQPWLVAPLALGFLYYQVKFLRRILEDRRQFGRHLPAALALTPALVVFGDVSKMAGYPVGWIWRYRMHPLAKKPVPITVPPSC